ncbi:TRP-domain-containing protein [Peniophora sp. CONT]|nr:TRP-domain-containing protein [Peniophora sp. CONT]
MIDSVAWLRRPTLALLAVLASVPLCTAHIDSLSTSSVSYCAPPESILIQQFDVTYFRNNNSVAFNISAASVQTNVSVRANLALDDYGSSPVNVTLDLCSLLDSVLCPLPLYNFVGYDVIPLPDSIDLSSLIPPIAYVIPDFEAVAQLSLYDVDTGELKACIQATLTNGWSMHQPAVVAATAALAGASFLNAFVQSLILPAFATLAPARFLDLVSLYQLVAASALLNLNYPVVYRAFALNFSWAFGLFGMKPTSGFEKSIDRMRNLTGGTVSQDAVGGATALVNRVLSPYNLVPTESSSSDSNPTMLRRDTDPLTDLFVRGANALARHVRESLTKRDDSDVSVAAVTPGSSNTLQAGIPIFAESINIATGNAFTTAFLIALILLAISLGVLALASGIVFLLARRDGKVGAWARAQWDHQQSWSKAWLLRVALLCMLPLLTLGLYQWTLADSWLADLLAAITTIVLFPGLAYAAFLVIRHRRAFAESNTVGPLDVIPSLSPLYAQYTPRRYYAFLPGLVAVLLRSLFTAFAPRAPAAQIGLILATETLLFIATVVLRPNRTKRADAVSIYLCVTRLACTAASVIFLTNLGIKPIPRVAVGIVCAVIWSLAVVVLFFNLLCNIGLGALWRRWRHGTAFGSTSSASSEPQTRSTSLDEKLDEKGRIAVLEKERSASASSSSGASSPAPSVLYGRASAPTPDRHGVLDPSVKQTYPAVTPATTFAEPPTASTLSSYGVQVPSKWSRRPSDGFSDSAYGGSVSSPSSPGHFVGGATPPSAGHLDAVQEHRAV